MFITHGGANSVYESLYFGTPMMGFAQGPDQFGMVYRLKNFGLGRIGDISQTPQQILATIEELALGESNELIKAR